MSILLPATFIEKIISKISPLKIHAELLIQKSNELYIDIKPIYKIDGAVVNIPSKLINQATTEINGHRVILDGTALKILREINSESSRWSTKQAYEKIEIFKNLGITLKSLNGNITLNKGFAKIDLGLALNSNDDLIINSEIIEADGRVLQKNINAESLANNNGYHFDGEVFRKIHLPNTAYNKTLLTSGTKMLSGEKVPQFLLDINANKPDFGRILKSEKLENLKIISGDPVNALGFSGDDDSIQISTGIHFKDPSLNHLFYTKEDAEKNKTVKFKRIEQGWLNLDEGRPLDKFLLLEENLRKNIPENTVFKGVEIPQILQKFNLEKSKSPWTVYFTEQVKGAHKVIDTPANVKFAVGLVESDGKSLLTLDPMYNHEKFNLTHDEVQESIQNNTGWVRKGNSWIQVDDEQHEDISNKLNELNLKKTSKGYAFPAIDRERYFQIFSLLGSIQHTEAYHNFLIKLNDFEKIDEVNPPSNFKGTLYDYQRHGLNWLNFLNQYSLNGILADDMGLGKTPQTLAAIALAFNRSNNKLPSLIICPASVVGNWAKEVEVFLYQARCFIYTSSTKPLNRTEVDYAISHKVLPIVITTFDVARLNANILNKFDWSYVVVDEAHFLKNPNTLRTKAIKTINAQNKLALTGTPIQNKYADLWSLFDLILPGHLSTLVDFNKKYSQKTNQNFSIDALNLKAKIKPFVLRRLKDDVLKDLPVKLISPQFIELTPSQVISYKKIAEPEKAKLDKIIDSNNVGASSMHILAAINHLKKICNYPPLITNTSQEIIDVDVKLSGKLIRLLELLEEISDGEDKVLVFSQSTQMLDIIEKAILMHNTLGNKNYLRLDGSVPPLHRTSLVERFQTDPHVNTFLISTKAGGTGLNLTKANKVVFYDHDWNPSNDNQAQDRAHRKGQLQPVTIFKLIAKGTIEEKILARQMEKTNAAQQIISVDSDGFKNITKAEILDLFTFKAY